MILISMSCVRAQAREADHLPREVDDRHRLAHVEEEDLALVGHRAGLEHEAHRFGDRHEVAGHLRVGDRHRAAVEDLAEERRHHAAAAAEDVAEANRRERPVVSPADVEHDSSAMRFVAPMTEQGCAALSVEMCTKRRQPYSAADLRAAYHVPSMLV